MKNSTQIRKRKKKCEDDSSVVNESIIDAEEGTNTTKYLTRKGILIVALLMFVLILFLCSWWLNVFDFNDRLRIIDNLSGERVHNISCQPVRKHEFPSCSPTHCARIIVGEFLLTEQVTALKNLFKKALKYGRANGGASIFDVYSGAISKGDKFINVYSLHASIGDGEIFHSKDFLIYHQVKNMVQSRIAEYYGIDYDKLFLTNPSFFSEITPRPPRTIHDEYWHTHTDRETYEAFEYTSLIYLSDYGTDFQGGRFIYEDNGKEAGFGIPPRPGLLSIFTSGKENPHRVEKVTEGVRYALTLGFTCNSNKRINIEF